MFARLLACSLGAAFAVTGAAQSDAAEHWSYQPVVRPNVPDVSKHPIDAFLDARLEAEGIEPAPRADKATQLRRLSFAVTGLPPKLATARAAAHGELDYEDTLERLVTSPHYAEHQARFWLDLARYADTRGYEADRARPHMWHYRDWVIRAFARDLPYDQFIIEQLAGDLLPEPTLEQRIATAFHRNTMTNDEGGTDDEEFRCEAVVDRVDTTFAVFLGTTMACARCHDHKYDPFSQREYYELFAFFNQTADADRTDEWPRLAAPPVLTMRELPPGSRRKTHVLLRGSFLDRGEAVEPDTPAVLPPFPADEPRNRLGLARWIASPENPLTARVAVNRIWAQMFGKGLIERREDFGTQGERPSHPELLDWLASEFAQRGFSVREMVRLIATTEAFRRSSVARPEIDSIDPNNRLLARGPRARLSAEELRDAALRASGLLHQRTGGPSVMPPQPPGMWKMIYNAARWQTSQGEDRYRRGLYTYWRRTAPYPSMVNFDATSRETCTIRRIETNTPLQALTLLNDPAFVECAQRMAQLEEDADLPTFLETVFLRVVGRRPLADEAALMTELHDRASRRFAEEPGAAKQFCGVDTTDARATRLATRALLCNVVLNLDEAITR